MKYYINIRNFFNKNSFPINFIEALASTKIIIKS